MMVFTTVQLISIFTKFSVAAALLMINNLHFGKAVVFLLQKKKEKRIWLNCSALVHR